MQTTNTTHEANTSIADLNPGVRRADVFFSLSLFYTVAMTTDPSPRTQMYVKSSNSHVITMLVGS